jgi:hypothetical protein
VEYVGVMYFHQSRKNGIPVPNVSENVGMDGKKIAVHRYEIGKISLGISASELPTYGITNAHASPPTSSNRPNGFVIPAATPLDLSQ